MNLEIGMYVRTREYGIGKVEYICDCVECIKRGYREPVIEFKNNTEYVTNYETEKAWYRNAKCNIIDLIEVGDYVNGSIVKFDEGELCVADGIKKKTLVEIKHMKNIKSIVTKEQFATQEYKIEGDKNNEKK